MAQRSALLLACLLSLLVVLPATAEGRAGDGLPFSSALAAAPPTATPAPVSCSRIWISNRAPLTGESVNVSGFATSGTGPNAIVAFRFSFGNGADTGWQYVGAWSGSAGSATTYDAPGFYQVQFYVRLASSQALGGINSQCVAPIRVGLGEPMPTDTP